MKLRHFDFPLPEQNIGYYPWWTRTEEESPKMLVVNRKTAEISEGRVNDIQSMMDDKSTLVYNSTKAVPSAYIGKCTKKLTRGRFKIDKIHMLLTRRINTGERTMYEFLTFPSRLLRQGTMIEVGNVKFFVSDYTVNKGKVMTTMLPDEEVDKELEKLKMPVLPQYIHREVEKGDYHALSHFTAKDEGSIAPSSAAMLLNQKMLMQMRLADKNVANVNTEINIGCFADHVNKGLAAISYDTQRSIISKESTDTLNGANEKVLAVGINTLKTLEESVNYKGVYSPHDKYINPNFIPEEYTFKGADMILTGFHIPKSQYLIMATAYCGYELLMKAYIHAIKKDYKFGIYGDAMLII